jgi:hypothetical protein
MNIKLVSELHRKIENSFGNHIGEILKIATFFLIINKQINT